MPLLKNFYPLPALHILGVAILLGLTGCKKENPPTPTLADPSAPQVPFREFKGVDATLQATYYSTRVDSGLIGLITYFQGIAFAAFRAADGSLTSPGNIHAEGTQLNPVAGVYTNQPVTNQGIDFGSSVAWDIMGGNSIPDIDEDLAGPVPEIGDLSTGDSASVDSVLKLSIDLESPYTKLGQIDSVRFLLRGNSHSITIRKTGTDTVYVSPAQLLSLGRGKAYLQAEAFRYQIKSYNGYRVAFLKKGVMNKALKLY